MLGYWNKSVYITYLGAFIAVFGLLFAIHKGNIDYAFAGMIIAAVCDMFDGKVARHINEREEIEKDFGVQIDSLADVICFITIPAVTLYLFGMDEVYQMLILALYVVCGIIRLAYFNVKMSDKDKAIEYYQGLPVPVGIFIFSCVWLIRKLCDFDVSCVYMFLVPLIGYLHISKIRFKKYTGTWFYVTISLLALILILLGLVIL